MLLCLRLAIVVVYVTGLQASLFEPTCDDLLIEPVGKTSYVDKFGVWELKGGEKIFHVWFYPTARATLESKRKINVYTWNTDSSEDKAFSTEETIPDDYTIVKILDKNTTVTRANFANRVKECMPWQYAPSVAPNTPPLMVHLMEQFPFFQVVADPHTIYPPQIGSVPECSRKLGAIQFANAACWSDDTEMVLLKPHYIFAFRGGESARKCQISHSEGTAAAGSLSPVYSRTIIGYTTHSAKTRQYTYCTGYYRTLWTSILHVITAGLTYKDVRYDKKIQFYDYNIQENIETPCADYVSKPCFENAFSFFGSVCQWVSESKANHGVTLEYLFKNVAPTDQASTMAYGNQFFSMDLTGLNIQVYLQNADEEGSWSGAPIRLTYQTRLYITEKDGYSCSGCQTNGMVPRGREQCNVPQVCEKCISSQRVLVESQLSSCVPAFAKRKCVACDAHYNRSLSDQYVCVACPPLWPTRKVDGVACTACEHTQYFDKGNAEGCLYLKSVADGMSFEGSTFFNGASYDEYMTSDSEKPRVIPPLYYRDLITNGYAWNASTRANRCEPMEVAVNNASVASVFTRNVFSTRVQFRSWCGHHEILKSRNALLRRLQCVGAPASFTAPALSTSVQDLLTYTNAAGYSLRYERNHVEVQGKKSVAEVTLSAGSVYCHYEIRREGRTDDCTRCTGTQYTNDCGPTYNVELAVPVVAGSGSCVTCEQRCPSVDSFFAVERLSCWSNGTNRVSASDATWYGSLEKMATVLSPYQNYWYKPAPCKACEKVRYVGEVPWIVARCGNKALFETWNVKDTSVISNVARPLQRLCCATNNVLVAASSGTAFTSDLGTRCISFVGTVTALNIYTRETAEAVMVGGGTPQCLKTIPDLDTTVMPFCPPGWFVDTTQPGCGQMLTAWNTACCSQCSQCATEASIKTSEYYTCPGSTMVDTQLAGCIKTCAEKHYQVNDTCVPCESCA